MSEVIRRVATSRLSRAAREQNRTTFLADAGEAKPTVDRLEITRVSAEDDVAEQLAVKAGEFVLRRRRRYLLDGTPVQMATSWIPDDLARGTQIEQPDTGPGGIYARLEEAGHRIVSFDEQVSARLPTAEEATQLGIPTDMPVIRILRHARGEARVLEVSIALLRSDRYLLFYSIDAE